MGSTMHKLGAGAVVALVASMIWVIASAEVVVAQDAANAAAEPAPADLSRGEELFDLCTYCHGPQGLGNAELGAPAIAGMPEWYLTAQLRNFRSGLRGLHPDDLEGMRMRPMSLTLVRPGDLESVAAYTASLPRRKPEPIVTGGNAAAGAGLYAVCQSCHGPDGQGNQGLNAPPLTHSGDWYLVAQLKKYQDGVRGSDPRDTNGTTMRSMVAVLRTEQIVKDVVAHIMTLSE